VNRSQRVSVVAGAAVTCVAAALAFAPVTKDSVACGSALAPLAVHYDLEAHPTNRADVRLCDVPVARQQVLAFGTGMLGAVVGLGGLWALRKTEAQRRSEPDASSAANPPRGVVPSRGVVLPEAGAVTSVPAGHGHFTADGGDAADERKDGSAGGPRWRRRYTAVSAAITVGCLIVLASMVSRSSAQSNSRACELARLAFGSTSAAMLALVGGETTADVFEQELSRSLGLLTEARDQSSGELTALLRRNIEHGATLRAAARASDGGGLLAAAREGAAASDATGDECSRLGE
jgi:hypothetical protein